MMRARAATVGIAVLALLVRTRTVRADQDAAADVQAARDEFKIGADLQERGRCEEAIPHFRRSFQLHHAPTTALHIAHCYRALHRPGEAAEVYRGILKMQLDASASESFKAAQRQAEEELPEVEQERRAVAFDRAAEEREKEEHVVRRGFYLQAAPVGLEYLCFGGTCGPLYHFHFEIGGHFGNDDKEKGTRHYGWVVAARQSFGQAAGTIARTQVRVGYDFGFPIGDHNQVELTLGLYAAEGFAFVSSSGGSAFVSATSLGIDGKFFFFRGLYAYFRAVDVGVIAADNVAAFVGTFLATGIGWAPVE